MHRDSNIDCLRAQLKEAHTKLAAPQTKWVDWRNTRTIHRSVPGSSLPAIDNPEIGKRVLVQFGKSKEWMSGEIVLGRADKMWLVNPDGGLASSNQWFSRQMMGDATKATLEAMIPGDKGPSGP
jgi:hypothetical protein